LPRRPDAIRSAGSSSFKSRERNPKPGPRIEDPFRRFTCREGQREIGDHPGIEDVVSAETSEDGEALPVIDDTNICTATDQAKRIPFPPRIAELVAEPPPLKAQSVLVARQSYGLLQRQDTPNQG
jgi:hypothetical protein